MKHELGKICFIIPYVGGGGAERVVSVLTSELAEQGYDVVLVKYYECENEYPVSSAVKVSTLVAGGEAEYQKLSYAMRIKKLRQILCKEAPKYVIPFLPHVSRHAFFATLGMNCKMIQTIRIAPWVSPASKLLRFFRDLLIACSYSTFVQTQSQKAYFPKWMHKKIAVIPNPVSKTMLEAEWSSVDELTQVMAVGRLSSQKNFKLAIDAVRMLRECGYHTVLNIYGEGEQRQELQTYIDSIGASQYCYLRGRSNNMIAEYCSNHIFFLSSDFEGMPNALMEALAVGMPCVSTDCETGPADLLGVERGLLVPVNDLKQAYSALKKMIDDANAARCMGKCAKEYMQAYYSSAAISALFIEKVIKKSN